MLKENNTKELAITDLGTDYKSPPAEGVHIHIGLHPNISSIQLFPIYKKMIKAIFSLGTIILLFSPVLCAQSDSLIENHIDWSSGLTLTLYYNNHYTIISITRISDDIFDEEEISTGKFSVSGNNYSLIDSIGKIRQRFIRIEDQLYPIKTYCYLSNIIWRAYPYDDHTDFSPENVTLNNNPRLKTLGPDSQKLSNNIYDLYSYNFFDILLYHDISNSYEIYYRGANISYGTWEKRSSRIIIHDDCLNHKFYFKVKESSLGENNFPLTRYVNYLEKIQVER